MIFPLLCLALLMIFLEQALAKQPAPKEIIANYEVHFIEDMIDHHAMAAKMSQMCVQKEVHEDLKSLCNKIITNQQEEITQLQKGLQNWYQLEHEPQMSKRQMQQMEELESLSAAKFEMEFMKSMINHHWRAIIESSQCIERAYHGKLENFCQKTVLMQAAEIEQMHTWLCEWHNMCQDNLTEGGKDNPKEGGNDLAV